MTTFLHRLLSTVVSSRACIDDQSAHDTDPFGVPPASGILRRRLAPLQAFVLRQQIATSDASDAM